jgi:hypothetical protein
LYDKPLFADRTSASIYKNVNRETGQGALTDRLSDDDAPETEVAQVLRQQPARGFEGADKQEKRSQRSKPVEFEKKTIKEDKAFGEAGLVGKDRVREPEFKRPKHN